MKQYKVITKVAGSRAALIALVGILFAAFPLAIVMLIPSSELPRFAAVLCWIAVAGGSLVIGYAVYAQIMRVEWTFEADEEKIRLNRSDHVGVLREIAVRDIARVVLSRGDSVSSGAFLYIESKTGDRFDVAGIVPHEEFLAFIRESYPSVPAEIK